jgi:hypothetical protein
MKKVKSKYKINHYYKTHRHPNALWSYDSLIRIKGSDGLNLIYDRIVLDDTLFLDLNKKTPLNWLPGSGGQPVEEITKDEYEEQLKKYVDQLLDIK